MTKKMLTRSNASGGDNTKAKNVFGFKPKWNFEEGLKYTIDRLKEVYGVIGR